ncbi:MAG: hypothetical protein II695_03320, partial [Oscillospiraceae bacterium]|nr:hypothetical protein [Oscillospiraceae bacterium]
LTIPREIIAQQITHKQRNQTGQEYHRPFHTTTNCSFLFFTNKGKVYRLKAYEVPEAGRMAKGMAIVNILAIEQGEKITAVIPDTKQYSHIQSKCPAYAPRVAASITAPSSASHILLFFIISCPLIGQFMISSSIFIAFSGSS